MIWDNSFALSVLPLIAQVLVTTVFITITGTAIAMCIGLVLAIMRRARAKWISLPAEAFVEFVRATPLLVQLYFLYFGLPVFGIFLFDGWRCAMVKLDNLGGQEATTKTAPMIRFERVSKSFGTTKVLNELELEVPPGEKLAVIGPSGSGKTTILRLLMTLERPNAGTIEVDGEPLWHEYKGDRLVPASERHLRHMRTRQRGSWTWSV